jgi:hypothetical protein
MGWQSDEAPGCEGYLVAMVNDDLPYERQGPCSVLPREQSAEDSPLRELGRKDSPLVPSGGTESAVREDVENIQLVRVACTCGWRSRVFKIGGQQDGYGWWPNVVACDERIRDNAGEVWSEHARSKPLPAGYLRRWTKDNAVRFLEANPAKGTS